MDEVSEHYGQAGLFDRIITALIGAGFDPEHLNTQQLAFFDEFHIRGRAATLELVHEMGLTRLSKVLDLGSGLGGPARTLAEVCGCHVTGIDLTQEFCDVATELSDRVGLSDLVEFRQGDATDLPFGDRSFDAAMTIHVAMNIAAKDKLYAEAKRVLRPGGIFAVYDVMQGPGGPIRYPVPWAMTPEISHVATPEEVEDLLRVAGFEIMAQHDSSSESLTWFKELTSDAGTKPPISSAVILGPNFKEMAGNQVMNLAEDRIRTVTFICRA